MRFFRSKWLQRILIFLFLILLNASGFSFVAKDGQWKNETFLHVLYHRPCLSKINSSTEKFQIRYVFDLFNIYVETEFKKTISRNYIIEKASDPVSFDLLTYLKRGPPQSIILI
jgi:hypothetical protein